MNQFIQNKFQVMVIILGIVLIILGVSSLTVACGNRIKLDNFFLRTK